MKYTPNRTRIMVTWSLKMQCCGIRCFFDPWIRIRDLGWTLNIPDYFSEKLETVYMVKNTWILWCGSGSGIRNLFDPVSGIRDLWSGLEKFWPGINIPDPQHCKNEISTNQLVKRGGKVLLRPPPFLQQATGTNILRRRGQLFLHLICWTW